MKKIKNVVLSQELIGRDFVAPVVDLNMPWQQAVSIITNALAEHIKSSAAVREYISSLEKGSGTNCPDSPEEEIIKYLAEQNGQIDKSDASVNWRFMNDLVFPVFDFERKCLANLTLGSNNLSAEEKHLVLFSLGFGEFIDKLYSRWYQDIVIDYQMLDKDKQLIYEKSFKKNLGQFDYTVYNVSINQGAFGIKFDYEDRQTWAEAYPKEIGEIVNLLDTAKNFEDDNLRNYFKALSSAFACCDISGLEEAWAKVDEAWIKIPADSRLIPIHGMENGYEHPYGISPEFRLVVRNDYGQDMISEIRQLTPAYAREIEISDDLVKLAECKMANMDMGIFVTVVKSGFCANFRTAGQVVPNRQDILKKGGKIFLDIDSSKNLIKTYKRLLLKYCEPEIGKLLADIISVDGLLADTISHECTHPIGCTPESDLALGDTKSRLEEAKATIGGLAAILSRKPENWAEIVALSIARICRFFTYATYNNPTDQAYVRENIVMANLLLAAKIVNIESYNEIKIKIDLSEGCLLKLQELMKYFYNDVVYNYHSIEPATAVQGLEKLYCFHNQLLEEWIDIVNIQR